VLRALLGEQFLAERIVHADLDGERVRRRKIRRA